MGGYSADPRTRLGLIALLAMRRVKAENLRRAKADDTPNADAPPRTDEKSRKSGWFR